MKKYTLHPAHLCDFVFESKNIDPSENLLVRYWANVSSIPQKVARGGEEMTHRSTIGTPSNAAGSVH